MPRSTQQCRQNSTTLTPDSVDRTHHDAEAMHSLWVKQTKIRWHSTRLPSSRVHAKQTKNVVAVETRKWSRADDACAQSPNTERMSLANPSHMAHFIKGTAATNFEDPSMFLPEPDKPAQRWDSRSDGNHIVCRHALTKAARLHFWLHAFHSCS